jgi:uncharacterized repeat protein (TIGR02543 family)
MYLKKNVSVLALLAILAGALIVSCDTDSPTGSIPGELTGIVSISGTARVYEILSADTSGLDGAGLVSYQWNEADADDPDAGWTAIDGATGRTYTLVAENESKYITVTVTRAGCFGSLTSQPTDKVPRAALTRRVRFDKNGGDTEANPAIKSAVFAAYTVACLPEPPTKSGYTFVGWDTRADGEGDVFGAGTVVQNDPTVVYAQWYEGTISPPITSVKVAAAYLSMIGGGTSVESPAILPMKIDLGVMTEADSNWRKLLGVLETMGMYVALDLSECTLNEMKNVSNEIYFRPDRTVITGKDRIVELTLPDVTERTEAGDNHGISAFDYFSNLKKISGASEIYLSMWALQSSMSLETVSFPNIEKYNGAFYNCTNLKYVNINSPMLGDGFMGVGFSGCTSLEEIDLSLTAITRLPGTVSPAIGASFSNCTKLKTIKLPQLLKQIGQCAFYNCQSLASITLPAGFTTIGMDAFRGCSSLNNIIIPAGVTSIGIRAFQDCINLTRVTFLGTPAISSNGIDGAYNYNSFPGASGANSLKDIATAGGAGTYVRDTATGDWSKE